MSRRVALLLPTLLAAALAGCSKDEAETAGPPPKTVYVDVTGVTTDGVFQVTRYRVDGQGIDADETALRAALAAAKAAAGDRPLVVDVLSPAFARYEHIVPVIRTAAAVGAERFTLAVPRGDATATMAARPKGQPVAMPAEGHVRGLIAEKADMTRLWVRLDADGESPIYELVDGATSLKTATALEDRLASRQQAIGAAAPVTIRPAYEVRAESVVRAVAAAKEAGFETVLFEEIADLPPLASPAGEGGAAADHAPVAAGPKPETTFSGATGSAYHVVYLIDRSGSMVASFDVVRDRLVESIGSLKPRQDFHVIFFGGRRPVEYPERKLIDANDTNKGQVIDFLKGIPASGITNPMPAIRRAFDVLDKADVNRPGKLVFLLTDGDFSDERGAFDNEMVLKAIRRRNARKDVTVHTLLFGKRSAAGEKVLKQIAEENNGNYSFVGVEG